MTLTAKPSISFSAPSLYFGDSTYQTDDTQRQRHLFHPLHQEKLQQDTVDLKKHTTHHHHPSDIFYKSTKVENAAQPVVTESVRVRSTPPKSFLHIKIIDYGKDKRNGEDKRDGTILFHNNFYSTELKGAKALENWDKAQQPPHNAVEELIDRKAEAEFFEQQARLGKMTLRQNWDNLEREQKGRLERFLQQISQVPQAVFPDADRRQLEHELHRDPKLHLTDALRADALEKRLQASLSHEIKALQARELEN